MIVVNKENKLSKDYIPKNLINVGKVQVSKKIYKDLIKLLNESLKDGINLVVESGYRSYSYQEEILKEFQKEFGIEETLKKVAKPGYSEHQTGLAIDFGYIDNIKYNEDIKENSQESTWLYNNSYKYGFILRYPKGKENITGYKYEPWHYRYVGKKIAKKIHNRHITLEDYIK